MGAPTDWSATTLCTHSDVTTRYASVDDLTGTTGAGADAVITAKIAVAKEYIGNILTAKFQERIYEMDIDADSDIRDWIHNPTIFKNSCVAWTLRLLFEDNLVAPEDYNDRMRTIFHEEFDREFNLALQLLQFDVDDDADLSQEEAAGGAAGYRFTRV